MRLNWDNYLMEIAKIVMKRSTCLRRQTGAVLVKDKRIISIGYNGAPTKLKHCNEIGCLRLKINITPGERMEICRAVYAEENTILQAALYGVSTKNSILYTVLSPCSHCAKSIINAKIKEVVCLKNILIILVLNC
ncbi:MAG: dCMP deaminase family protein [Candidatus Pacearchaeota archaeon]